MSEEFRTEVDISRDLILECPAALELAEKRCRRIIFDKLEKWSGNDNFLVQQSYTLISPQKIFGHSTAIMTAKVVKFGIWPGGPVLNVRCGNKILALTRDEAKQVIDALVAAGVTPFE